MAYNFKYARLLSMSQTVLGCVILIFGIADRATAAKKRYENYYYYDYQWPAIYGVPIWTAVLFIVTGVLGILASRRRGGYTPNKALVGTHLGFSVKSTILAFTVIVCYAMSIGGLTIEYGCSDRYGYDRYDNDNYYNTTQRRRMILLFSKKQCETIIGLGSVILFCAILMFGISIWVAVCSCMGLSCDCCKPVPQQQPQFSLNTAGGPNAGYVVVQGPDGNPVAVPAAVGPMAGPGGPTPFIVQQVAPPVMVHTAQGGQVQGGYMTYGGEVTAGYEQPQEPETGPLLQNV